MIELEINQQKISIQEGATIIQAADQAGIYIPRFCYHRKLSVVANCRMCLVEIEGVPKSLPACATLVSAGMKVFTASPKALEAQRAVMEFLLINHPLDCPICDQGGECELQDQAMGYGRADSEYDQSKRAVFSEDIGPLVETEMTRCIHCTRCIRFGDEVAGLPELGATFRGENMEIGTYVKHFMHSEVSGNVIDLCPVGALTSKPFDYTARSWEMREHPFIAPHDCLGSHLFVHTRGMDNFPQRRVMRVVPRANEAINEVWLSDRDRFSYQGLHHEDRVLKPMVKRNGQWHSIEWQPALLEMVDRTRAILNLQDAKQIGALASPNSTVEEFYLLQRLFNELKSPNKDHRLTQADLSLETDFNLGLPLSGIDQLSAVLLVGSNIRQEQPLVATRLYKAYKVGAQIMAVNAMDYEFNFNLNEKLIVPSPSIPSTLTEIAWALAELNQQSIEIPKPKISEAAHKIAQNLKSSPRAAIFMGLDAINHPEASFIRQLIQIIADLSNAEQGAFTVGANSAGAYLTDFLPGEGGLNAAEMFNKPLRAYYLLGVEPEFDSAYPAKALAALKDAGLVVCFNVFKTPAMLEYADFILPIAPFTENSGTLVNVMGEWQSFHAASVPHGDSKPAWKVLRVLANLFEFSGFDYQKPQEIMEELKASLTQRKERHKHNTSHAFKFKEHTGLSRLAPWPIYRADPLLRRASALQETQSVLMKELASIAVNQHTADKLKFKAGEIVTAIQAESSLSLPLSINNRLPNDVVFLASGLNETAGFGCVAAPIELKRGEL